MYQLESYQLGEKQGLYAYLQAKVYHLEVYQLGNICWFILKKMYKIRKEISHAQDLSFF